MLIRRIVTALIFGITVIAALGLLPSLWAGVVLGAIWLAGVYEWAGFAGLGKSARLGFVLVNALLMAAIGQLLHFDVLLYWLLSAALLWWLLAFATLCSYPREFSVLWTIAAGLATLVPAWGLLAWLHSETVDGPMLILALLAFVWSADSGAYFFGRAFGRRKLAPSISPGKTWEGVIGGLLTAAVVGAATGFLAEEGMLRVAWVAAATAALSVVGDLNVSMFKRNAGLKDSGRLLPGHGGVLDRADSVTAAVAMFVLGLILVGIIT